MDSQSPVFMFVDGACRGNPGEASYGAVFYDEKGLILFELSHRIGTATNNIAEYTSLLKGMLFAKEKGMKILHAFSDSQIMVQQVLGRYRVKSEHLRSYYQKVVALIPCFETFSIKKIPRNENKKADLLANMALDA